MAIKTVPIRSIEKKVENMYEAVCIMFGQAKRILDDRIVEASIKDAEEEDYSDESQEAATNETAPATTEQTAE